MDQYLAQMYGTGQEAGDVDTAITKIAADLQEEDINIDDLTDEQVEALVAAYAEEGAPEETATDGETEKTAEAEQKFAEADYMGRIIAHSFVNEVGDIQKQASAGGEDREKDAARGKAKKLLARMTGGRYGKATLRERLGEAAQAVGKGAKKVVGKIPGGKAGRIAAGVGAAGALGAGGYAAMRKKSSDTTLDAAIEAKAIELLQEALAEEGE